MTPSSVSGPALSVAVASTGDPELLNGCLNALETALTQVDDPVAVFVARPASAIDAAKLFADRPWASLVLVEGDSDIPQLRGVAMGAAGEGWIAVTEDIFLADRNWLMSMSQNTKSGFEVIGGAVGNVRPDVVSHAAYLTDYGSFSPSRSAEEGVSALTGANVIYSPAVSGRAGRWAHEGAWEHVIHDRLIKEGVQLRFEPLARVDHNATYNLRELISVRFQHGLHYARDRLGEHGSDYWVVRVLLAPALPFLLVFRLLRVTGWSKMGRFVRTAPLLFVLYVAWVAGETLGYMKERHSKE